MVLRGVLRLEVHLSEEPGMVEFGGRLPGDEASALLRAVMRIEAELLRGDADELPDGACEQRTAANRRADALLILITRACAAIPFVRLRSDLLAAGRRAT